jgi:hypothetical protein
MATVNNQVNPLAQNDLFQRMLLASAPRMRKDLGLTTGTLGNTSRIKLANVGLLTSLTLQVSLPVTIGTAAATLGKQAPWNMISRVRLTDFDGTDRVIASGYQLYVWNSVRNRYPYGWNNEGSIVGSNGSPVSGGVIGQSGWPKPTLSTGASTIDFIVEIPVAYDPNADLRGTVVMQTNLGEMYLSIDWISSSALFNAAGDDTNLFNGAATTTVTPTSPTVRVFQNYLLPQAIGGVLPIPAISVQTVYEFNGNLRTSDNLSANSERLLNYPNVRTVIGTYINYMNGGALLSTDVSKIRLIANGNNILREMTQELQLFDQRCYLEGDLNYGTYFLLHRDRPIETQQYGNVQLGFTPTSVGTGSYLEWATESFYPKGAVLPGMNQS